MKFNSSQRFWTPSQIWSQKDSVVRTKQLFKIIRSEFASQDRIFMRIFVSITVMNKHPLKGAKIRFSWKWAWNLEVGNYRTQEKLLESSKIECSASSRWVTRRERDWPLRAKLKQNWEKRRKINSREDELFLRSRRSLFSTRKFWKKREKKIYS